ncbi:aminoglycoside phosphotransferase [Paenibacillus elgii]|uniref:Aminoglycoside phosphotransferase n=1 Tax=Paenibacillus elgii TaxID=189691 RepID=A0A2T6G0R2_9BACL|nr:aminoglycoside phosphotransferase family protein [Paenibacillus elgii]PUA37760.1 aminoglycoside phosphotransferase [Paenibacillus elgii]
MEDTRQNAAPGEDEWQEKADWERREPFVRLSLAELNGLLESAFPGRSVEFAQSLGTGLSNSNYKIRMRGEERSYVLRIYRGDADVLRKEEAIARLVRSVVPVPAFLYTDASCARFPRPWALLEWHDGELLSSLRTTVSQEELASAAAALGRTLARVHAFPFQKAGLLGPELEIRTPMRLDEAMFTGFAEQSLMHGEAGRLLGSCRTEALWAMCRRHAGLLEEQPNVYSLIHSDFNGRNVLLAPDGAGGSEVTAVLDWEFAFAGPPLVDIGNMLRYEPPGSEFGRHFIRGYVQGGGVLPERWELKSKLADLIALLDLLNRAADAPNRAADLVRLIDRLLAEWA